MNLANMALAWEVVELSTTQRVFQANSRVMATSCEALSDSIRGQKICLTKKLVK
jgi:flagellar hook protein FlgE